MHNDGGIKPGRHRKQNVVRHKPGAGRHGSGLPGDGGANGNVIARTDSLAEPIDRDWVDSDDAVVAAEDMENFHVAGAGDPTLGLTNVPGHPPEDWAADTGPTRTPGEWSERAPAPDETGHPLAPRKRPSPPKK